MHETPNSKLKILMLAFLFVSSQVFAGSVKLNASARIITGQVTSTKGETLIGVSIKVKGTSTGDSTEVGMDVSATAACKAFLSDIILKTNSVSGKNGLGVFYREPQAYNSWKGYNPGAFNTSGKPTEAIDAFLIK